MRNRALEHTVYVIAAGAFGVFVRWLQLQLAFDEKGLCGPSIFNYVVPLYVLIVAWVLRRRVGRELGGKFELPADYRTALANPGRLYAALRWLFGALMAAGGVLAIRGSDVEKQTLLLRLIGGAAIASGLVLPLYLGWANGKCGRARRALLCLIGLVPIVLFGIWLVYDYVSNAINSVIWAYLIEVLTVSTLMLAYFRLAGFAYGQVDPKKTLFWLQFGVFLSITVLADERRTGLQVILLTAGLLLALADFILLRNFREKGAGDEKKPGETADELVPNGGIERL